jgi:hypothetical protein
MLELPVGRRAAGSRALLLRPQDRMIVGFISDVLAHGR